VLATIKDTAKLGINSPMKAYQAQLKMLKFTIKRWVAGRLASYDFPSGTAVPSPTTTLNQPAMLYEGVDDLGLLT